MLSHLQIALLVAAAIYSGGVAWHFFGCPSLAKKIGWFVLLAAVAGIVWFLVLPHSETFDERIFRALALRWLMIPLILAFPLVITLWIGGLYSARWLTRKSLSSRPLPATNNCKNS